MLEVTDCHFRAFMRLITRCTYLYTEMVVDETVLYQSKWLDYYIGKGDNENPCVLQLGGNNPETLAAAAQLCQEYGNFTEINLNCGCPSPKVSSKCFGARLMEDPKLVQRIVSSIGRRVSVPVTVKCRIGVDGQDSYDDLCHFISTVAQGGVKKFIIHARSCILDGLSARQNREIPPLKYHFVKQLTQDFPDMEFILNGGLSSLEKAQDAMRDVGVDGVMLGRAAQNNPMIFATADRMFYEENSSAISRREVLEKYMSYCDWAESDAAPYKLTSDGSLRRYNSSVLLRPVQHVMAGCANSSKFRAALTGPMRCRNEDMSSSDKVSLCFSSMTSCVMSFRFARRWSCCAMTISTKF